MRPNFQHIHDVFNLELGKNPKIAYRFSETVCPASIEKANVKLEDSLFHETVTATLRTYASDGHPEYN